MSEEQKQPEACIVIYDNSQGIVATRFRCDGILTMTLLQICCRYGAYLHDLPCRLALSSYRGRVAVATPHAWNRLPTADRPENAGVDRLFLDNTENIFVYQAIYIFIL